ncbi:MAG: WYL domain-containing protein [Lachnospiraceae bacterium]|nr:WYL domain-containing protein [Lachnospiraceae bacterium]
MDKITRLLLLFSKLVNGEKINKTIFCFENDCSPRTFDRDIENIRLYLSESFSSTELRYERSTNTYFIDGAKHKLLEPMEYLLIERILKDSMILRKDEFDILSMHLLQNTEKTKRFEGERQEICSKYQSPLHNKALLKIHGDLVNIIRAKKCINIKYFKSNGEEVNKKILPCDVKYDLGYLYLIGYRAETEDEYPAYYRMDRIFSFEILNSQSASEQYRVRKYFDKYADGITQMYGGFFIEIGIKCLNDFYPYIYDKFRNVKIVTQDEQYVVIKLEVFEDGFIKWLMSQSTDMVTVLYPDSTIEKIRKEARNIMNKYGGVGQWQRK